MTQEQPHMPSAVAHDGSRYFLWCQRLKEKTPKVFIAHIPDHPQFRFSPMDSSRSADTGRSGPSAGYEPKPEKICVSCGYTIVHTDCYLMNGYNVCRHCHPKIQKEISDMDHTVMLELLEGREKMWQEHGPMGAGSLDSSANVNLSVNLSSQDEGAGGGDQVDRQQQQRRASLLDDVPHAVRQNLLHLQRPRQPADLQLTTLLDDVPHTVRQNLLHLQLPRQPADLQPPDQTATASSAIVDLQQDLDALKEKIELMHTQMIEQGKMLAEQSAKLLNQQAWIDQWCREAGGYDAGPGTTHESPLHFHMGDHDQDDEQDGELHDYDDCWETNTPWHEAAFEPGEVPRWQDGDRGSGQRPLPDGRSPHHDFRDADRASLQPGASAASPRPVGAGPGMTARPGSLAMGSTEALVPLSRGTADHLPRSPADVGGHPPGLASATCRGGPGVYDSIPSVPAVERGELGLCRAAPVDGVTTKFESGVSRDGAPTMQADQQDPVGGFNFDLPIGQPGQAIWDIPMEAIDRKELMTLLNGMAPIPDLQKMQGADKPSKIRAWLYGIGVVTKSCGPEVQAWWNWVKTEAEKAHAIFLTTPVMSRAAIAVRPRCPRRWQIVESRVRPHLLQALPGHLKEKAMYRGTSDVDDQSQDLVYMALRDFSPGDAVDKQNLLAQIQSTTAAATPLAAVQGLRRWTVACTRAQELGLDLPDVSVRYNSVRRIILTTLESDTSLLLRFQLLELQQGLPHVVTESGLKQLLTFAEAEPENLLAVKQQPQPVGGAPAAKTMTGHPKAEDSKGAGKSGKNKDKHKGKGDKGKDFGKHRQGQEG